MFLIFCTLIGSFCKNHLKFQLKKYRRVISHDIEEWWKVWRKTDLWFQIWHEGFSEFSPNHSKVWKFHSDEVFLSKVCEVWANKDIEELYLSWHWTVVQNLNKSLTLCFQKWHEEFGEYFNWRTQKSEKLFFDGLFLSKAYNASVRNIQKNYVSWHWKVM